MRSTENTTTTSSSGPRTLLRSLLALVITALALTVGVTASPTVASAESCDGTYVTMAIIDEAGTVVAVLDSRDPREVTLPFRRYYLAPGGTIRPNGFAVFSIYRDLPAGPVLVAQVRKTAEGNGVIRQEPASFDTSTFARPGDRFRVQGFWETNAFCTPSRALDATLGWINLV
jgi:hypothetical protein